MRILFVVPYAPTRIRTRPYHFIRALGAEGHEVTVATTWTDDDERRALDELAASGVRLVTERLAKGRSAWNCLRALPGREPLQSRYSWSPALATRIGAAAGEGGVDAVHVEHLRGVRYGLELGRQLARRPDRPVIVWDSVDCISALFRHAAAESPSPLVRLAARVELPRTERYEGAVTSRFDRVLVTSDADRAELLRLAPPGAAPRIEVVPNGVDLEYFAPSTEPREPTTLVISGKMSYHANLAAVSDLLGQIMPAVWNELPDVKLWIVGKDPSSELMALAARDPRVVVTGTVDDLRPYLRRATLAVAPVRYSAGIQNKVLEALACETPVVASPQAVSALDVASDSQLVVASGAREFASSVVALLRDPLRRVRLGRTGRAFVEQRHAWSSAARRLTDIYGHARA